MMTVSALGASPVGPFASPVAHADLGYNTEALARLSPEDVYPLNVGPTQGSSLSAGQLGVTVISTGLGLISGKVALQQNVIARQRSREHSKLMHAGSLEQLRATPQNVLREMILKDTIPGDVVRLEYIAGNEETLAAAVDELKHGKAEWEARVAKLKAAEAIILKDIVVAKGHHGGLSLNNQSRGIRLHYMETISDLQKQLAELKPIKADADMRIHLAREQYHAAHMTLESVRKANHQMPPSFHIIRDILVDGKTATELDTFFMKNLGISQIVPSKMDVPHIRIVRIQTPNMTLSKKAARVAKAGAVGVVIAGGLVIEELTVGAIGESLTKNAETQLSPEARTEPRR